MGEGIGIVSCAELVTKRLGDIRLSYRHFERSEKSSLQTDQQRMCEIGTCDLFPLSFIPPVPYPPLRGTFPSRGRLTIRGKPAIANLRASPRKYSRRFHNFVLCAAPPFPFLIPHSSFKRNFHPQSRARPTDNLEPFSSILTNIPKPCILFHVVIVGT